MTDKREPNENSLKNLKMFSKDYQPTPEAKSEGKKRAQEKRIALEMMNEYIFNKLMDKGLIDTAIENAEMHAIEGCDNKDIIELLKIIKPNNKQTVELEGQVQKIYVTKEEMKNVKDHIKEFIE